MKGVNSGESSRSDTDNRERSVFNINEAANRAGIASEILLPEIVADYSHRVGAQPIIFLHQKTTEMRRDLNRGEEIAAYKVRAQRHMFGIDVEAYVHAF